VRIKRRKIEQPDEYTFVSTSHQSRNKSICYPHGALNHLVEAFDENFQHHGGPNQHDEHRRSFFRINRLGQREHRLHLNTAAVVAPRCSGQLTVCAASAVLQVFAKLFACRLALRPVSRIRRIRRVRRRVRGGSVGGIGGVRRRCSVVLVREIPVFPIRLYEEQQKE